MDAAVSAAPPCPACGATATAGAFTARDWALRAAPGEFSFARCGACATVFAEPQPSDAELAAAYASSYGNYQADRSLVERIAEPLAQREATRVAAIADPGGPMLELGCGTGRFLERLRHAGWRGPLAGVEYSAEVAAATGERLGIPVAAGTVESADLGPEPLALLVLRHVIEHLRDPAVALDRARSALRRDGVLYIATPDARALSARAFGRYWWGYEVPRHLVVFSRDGLRRLVEAHGFRIAGEWWSFAPQMWNASLGLALDRGEGRPWVRGATHLLNPAVTVPAVALAGLEVLVRRSTMYALAARPA
jgi:SAM-dependent methyltransferase